MGAEERVEPVVDMEITGGVSPDPSSETEEATGSTDDIDIEALKAEQEEHLRVIREAREKEEAAAARKVQASEDLKEHDELRKEQKKIDDSLPGGISHEGIRVDKLSLAEIDDQIDARRTENDQLRSRRDGVDDKLAQLAPITEGLPEDQIAEGVKNTLNKLNVQKAELDRQIQSGESEMRSLTQQREAVVLRIDESSEPVKRSDEIEARMKEITDKPEVMDEAVELANRENAIREQYIESGVRQLLHVGQREEPSESETEFAKDVLQLYLDEEIKRRGYDDLEPDERLTKIGQLTKNMVYGMQHPVFDPGRGHKEYEIQQLGQSVSNWGKDATADRLHGMALRTLLGCGGGSPSNALYPLAYASSVEAGKAMNLYDIESSPRDHWDKPGHEAFSKLRDDILSHDGTLTRLMAMADAQDGNKVRGIYNDNGDWNYVNGSMRNGLRRIGINAHTSGFEAESMAGMPNRGELPEYRRQQKLHSGMVKQSGTRIEKRKDEIKEADKQTLAEKEGQLTDLEDRIKKVDELAREKDELRNKYGTYLSDHNSSEETTEIHRLEETIRFRSEQILDLSDTHPSWWQGRTQAKKDEFYRGLGEEKKQLEKKNEETRTKIQDIKDAPRKRKLRMEEIGREIERLTGSKFDSDSVNLKYKRDRLNEEIERLRKIVGEPAKKEQV